jgi:peptide/nickel transport system permease protein
MLEENYHNDPYWKIVWRQFCRRPYGLFALFVVALFALTGVFAPFLASSKPLIVNYEKNWYFPLFRYLFYSGFYTKPLDLFFNLFIFTLPLALLCIVLFRHHSERMKDSLYLILLLHFILFLFVILDPLKDPASDPKLIQERQLFLQAWKKDHPGIPLSWSQELQFMPPYAKLNLLLREQQREAQNQRLAKSQEIYAEAMQKKGLEMALRDRKKQLLRKGVPLKDIPGEKDLEEMILKEAHLQPVSIPILWQIERENENQKMAREHKILEEEKAAGKEGSPIFLQAQARLNYILERRAWIETQILHLKEELMPFVRSFHWEDDAGGDQTFNQYINWWERTRINRKDLLAALIFGVRISLVVGLMSVGIALLIGIPIGAFAGYYGGKFDIVVSRLLEIWEAMPTFFMLLMVVAITQSKSIFLVIGVIGIFGWTTFSRYIRGEFFKQRSLAYAEACKAQGFRDPYIIFSHILPNAIPPLLTLLPFAIMGAITSEAGLSFLGLGEEGSCSWGVLMDEGRSAFPAESYLLWPPAILLTILLVAIALVGDALRDALDPKMHK